jgi:osmotically inducible protein OsmC
MQHVPRIDRSATAVWAGSVARGSGEVSSPSLTLTGLPFTLAGRTVEEVGETSPEELLAAAHAACFSMALSGQLTRRRAPPDRLTVTATSSLAEVDGFNRIVAGALVVEVVGPMLPPGELEGALREADERCPFSALLRDAGATVTVTLSSHVGSS